jgi:hypothetical protein
MGQNRQKNQPHPGRALTSDALITVFFMKKF